MPASGHTTAGRRTFGFLALHVGEEREPADDSYTMEAETTCSVNGLQLLTLPALSPIVARAFRERGGDEDVERDGRWDGRGGGGWRADTRWHLRWSSEGSERPD